MTVGSGQESRTSQPRPEAGVYSFLCSESLSLPPFWLLFSLPRAPLSLLCVCSEDVGTARTVDSAMRTRRHFRLHVPRAISERQRSFPFKGYWLVSWWQGDVAMCVSRFVASPMASLLCSFLFCIIRAHTHTYIHLFITLLPFSLSALGMPYSRLPPSLPLLPYHRTCEHHTSHARKHVR